MVEDHRESENPMADSLNPSLSLITAKKITIGATFGANLFAAILHSCPKNYVG